MNIKFAYRSGARIFSPKLLILILDMFAKSFRICPKLLGCALTSAFSY